MFLGCRADFTSGVMSSDHILFILQSSWNNSTRRCLGFGARRQGQERIGSVIWCSGVATMSVKEGDGKVHRVISIGPSHYCEKARWALERAYVPFIEEKHAPAFHIPSTRGMPGGTSCPKLVMGKGPDSVVISDSHAILEFADTKLEKEEDRLYPSDPEQLQLVQSWESKFDNQLGPHVRRYAYTFLLFSSSSYKLLTQGASTPERIAAWLMMPLLRRLLYRGLNCQKPGGKEQSLEVMETIFKEVDGALADGRPYICGSAFTAADLTFAALGGPLVAPPEYGAWLPPLDDTPSELATLIKRFQGTPAGQHILKIYETKRRRPEEKMVY